VRGLWERVRAALDAVEFQSDRHHASLLYDRFESVLMRSGIDERDVNSLHGAVTALVCRHEMLEPLKAGYKPRVRESLERRAGEGRRQGAGAGDEEEEPHASS
jgi:hypothetical protein